MVVAHSLSMVVIKIQVHSIKYNLIVMLGPCYCSNAVSIVPNAFINFLQFKLYFNFVL